MQYKEDNKKDFDERKDYSHVVQKKIDAEKERNSIEIIQKKKIDIIDEGKEKGMERQQSNSTLTNSKETLRKEIDIGKERNIIRKEKEDDSLVNKERTKNIPRNNDSLKEKIDERLKSIERSMIYTQDNGLAELAKKIEILNSPLDIDKKRDITILNNIDNEKTDRHIRNTICHKCRQYVHTKKQCDRHNKIIKQISKLEFEKDVINKLMEMFDVKQKEIDQVKEKEELKSTNPLKVNKRKRKQKDIIMKLIENLPNHLKDKKILFTKIERIYRFTIACFKCKKYGHHATECGKKEEAKKEKDKKEMTKMKQDGVGIKPVTLQDLIMDAKIVKQEIKEDNSTDIDE